MKIAHFRWAPFTCLVIIILVASGALIWFGGLLLSHPQNHVQPPSAILGEYTHF